VGISSPRNWWRPIDSSDRLSLDSTVNRTAANGGAAAVATTSAMCVGGGAGLVVGVIAVIVGVVGAAAVGVVVAAAKGTQRANLGQKVCHNHTQNQGAALSGAGHYGYAKMGWDLEAG